MEWVVPETSPPVAVVPPQLALGFLARRLRVDRISVVEIAESGGDRLGLGAGAESGGQEEGDGEKTVGASCEPPSSERVLGNTVPAEPFFAVQRQNFETAGHGAVFRGSFEKPSAILHLIVGQRDPICK